MFFQKESNGTHVFCELDESEQEVLRAIVIASFCSAPVIGMGILQYNGQPHMTNSQADQFIHLDNDHSLICMDYVNGQQVKTYFTRIETGHFLARDYIFERDRGPIQYMLKVAQKLLAGQEDNLYSTEYLYRGEALDIRALTWFGQECIRHEDESDWEFRKRIFTDHYDSARDECIFFLLGGTMADVSANDLVPILAQVRYFGSSPEFRQKFTAIFYSEDPAVVRKLRTGPAQS